MQPCKLVPRGGEYRQQVGGDSDANVKPSLIGQSVQGVVENRKLLLVCWQRVFSCEFDAPRAKPPWMKWTGR